MRRHADKQDSERWYGKATKDFDRWFYSLPKRDQDTMRAQGVLPYREMLKGRFVMEYDNERPIAMFDSENETANSETFYSREKVGEFVRRLLGTLERSHSPDVRLHFQLIRIVLRDPKAMDGEQLGRLFRMTRAGINHRVQKIREELFGEEKTISNENIQREDKGRGSLRLRKVPQEIRKVRRQGAGVSKKKVSNRKRAKGPKQQAMERIKQGEACGAKA